jgi:hypothetical protein
VRHTIVITQFHTCDRSLDSKRGNLCHSHVSTRALDPRPPCSGFPFGVERVRQAGFAMSVITLLRSAEDEVWGQL